MLCKTKGTTVQDGRGVCLQKQSFYSIPWEKSIWGPSEAAWMCSPQNLKWRMIYLLSVILFLFYLIKIPILLCHFLSGLSYWYPEGTLHALSLSLNLSHTSLLPHGAESSLTEYCNSREYWKMCLYNESQNKH